MKTTKLETSDLKGVKVSLDKVVNTTKGQLLNDVSMLRGNMKDKMVALDINVIMQSLNLVKENLVLVNENLVLVNRNLDLVKENLLLVKESLLTDSKMIVRDEALAQVEGLHHSLKTKMVNASSAAIRKTK